MGLKLASNAFILCCESYARRNFRPVSTALIAALTSGSNVGEADGELVGDDVVGDVVVEFPQQVGLALGAGERLGAVGEEVGGELEGFVVGVSVFEHGFWVSLNKEAIEERSIGPPPGCCSSASTFCLKSCTSAESFASSGL
jgi:hypothetical protein